MTEPRLLRVALPVPLRRVFDYTVPAGWPEDALRPGCRVRVPFGRGRTLTGLIVDRPARAAVAPGKLKRALVALDEAPLLPPAHLDFLRHAAAYYQHPAGEALFHCLPARFRAGTPVENGTVLHYRLVPGAAERAGELQRAPKRRLAVQLLAAAGGGLDADALAEHGISRAVLAALVEAGLVAVARRPAVTAAATSGPTEAVTLNPVQARAATAIAASLGTFVVYVLNGVTGSGKTEVYLAVIAEALRSGAQALVLVPEIGLTPQLVDRVRSRIGGDIAVLHSALPDGERARAWLAARDGRVRVVLGTRSAVWTPLARPGVIVVDEEHDPSYKQQDGYRYSARDMAVARAKAAGVPIMLGSATPSLETLRNVAEGRYAEIRLSQRTGAAPPPQVSFVDLRGVRLAGAFSPRLLEAVRETVARGEQALLFLNRRGYAPALQCHACGTVVECPRCNVPYTWHKQRDRLLCHHCGSEQPGRHGCGACPDGALQQIGHGTERLTETLAQHLPAARVLRIDRDSTRTRGAFDRMMAQVHGGEADILVGTQMLAKGHHFPALTLVGIIDADRGLYSADFRAAERMAQLFVQVCGRAGRGDRPGRVFIQTHHPDHPLLRSLVEYGYGRFAELALAERAAAQLPPYSYLALLRAEHYEPGPAQRFLEQARTLLSEADAGIELHGPVPSAMERRAGRYRFQLVLQSARRGLLARALPPWLAQLEALPAAGRVRWSLDVDPQDML
jgi:primosomal protein N' (replication factor Y)